MGQPEAGGHEGKFHLPFVWAIVLAVLLVDLFVMSIGYVWLQNTRQQYQSRAEVVSQNIARLLEQSIADSIERVEFSLHAVNDEISKQMMNGGVTRSSLNAFIARQHARLPDLESVSVCDAEGTVRYGVNLPDSVDVNMAADSHYQYQRDNSDAGVTISAPQYEPISKKWTIRVSKRYTRPDGSFAGLISGVIDLDYFDMLFSSLNVGAKGTIALRDEQLGIVARYPKAEDAASLIGNKQVSQLYRDFLRTQPYKGTFTAPSQIDGIERIYSYQKVGKWPLYVQVGLATEDNLFDWRRTINNTILVGFLFLLLSFVLAFVIYRYWFERKRYFDEIEKNRKKFRALAELSSDWFWEQDQEFRFTGVTSDVRRKYGINGENYEGRTRWEIAVDKNEEEWAAHKALLNAYQPFYDFEYCVTDDKGAKRYIRVSGEPVFGGDGSFQGYRGVGKDVTERRQYAERIEHMAQYDTLTNLPNRALFYDRLRQAVQRARRDRHELALLYFDLDKFKPVNDEHGHAAGDQLLTQVAWRVKALLRESDTVARLGGDEFAALLPRVKCREDAEEVAQKIISALMEPFALDHVGKEVFIGVSIGIAIYPYDAETEDCLIKYADAAMYKSKQTRNCYHFYGDMKANGSLS